MGDSGEKLQAWHGQAMHPERRRWVLVLCYCLAVLISWLLPSLLWGSARPYGEAWLAPARGIVMKLLAIAGIQGTTTAGEFIVALGSLCIFGALLSPLLVAFLSRSWMVRLLTLAMGAILLTVYVGLAFICFTLDRWSLD
jgi:hypothetical protein